MPQFRFRAGVFLLALIFALNVCAQSTATLTGIVTDATGAFVPNATVTAKNLGTGEERSVRTDESGSYVIASLPVGRYRVESRSQGMQPIAVSDLTLEVGRTVQQNFTSKGTTTS